ncbi:MAG: DUF2914 domain-containing protein [Betaproteobacteria bacterium]
MEQPQTITDPPGRLQLIKLYYEKHERNVAIGAFVGGFLFDIVTTGRIDSWLLIGQQALYLLVVTTALLQMLFEEGKPPPAPANMFFVKRWYYEWRTAIVHFLLGSLISLHTIFFFKSSSFLVSFFILLILVFLLVANEFSRFRALGLPFKFALLSLCVLSFFASVVPVFVGSIGVVVFMLSMLLGCVPLAVIYRRLLIHAPDRVPQARRQIVVPFGLVLVAFLALYLLRLIPPVPLSIPYIGVYHAVERTADIYRLSHERPFWRFWHNGDQNFLAQPGDKVYVFFRIFSPTRFSDQVTMRWYWKDYPRGWALQDSIPINIVGGREQGFRGYGVKSNYLPGDWKVQVETTDGREIGRVYFSLATAAVEPRIFDVDLE